MDISALVQEGRLVPAIGLGVAAIGLLGLIYSITWRRRRLLSPMSIALVLLAMVGTAITGLGTYSIKASTMAPATHRKPADSAPPAEPPELGTQATLNESELGMLQKATLRT